ncbi:MAG: hypothetical protein QXT45_00950 [Candidatus Bilamarchaeaceae archaeon]
MLIEPVADYLVKYRIRIRESHEVAFMSEHSNCNASYNLSKSF